MKLYLGVDIGGTYVKTAAISVTGQVRARGVLDTNAGEGPRKAFRRIRSALPALTNASDDFVAAGVGCAGLIDPVKGRLYSSPNLPTWENTPLKRIAESAFGVYTNIDNDATSAAYGEYRCGTSKGQENMVFITLGTGVGGGIICDGRPLRGVANYAGEVGHMTISEDGPKCRCGNRGCLEAYVGTYGLVRTTRELLKQKSGRVLRRYLVDEKRKLTPQVIMEAARLGDAVATKVVKNAGEHLGVGIASLINIFNPGVVVIGGGVSGAFDLLQPHIKRTVGKRAYAESARMTRLVRSSLGNDATVVGAAMLAKDTLPTQP